MSNISTPILKTHDQCDDLNQTGDTYNPWTRSSTWL